MKNLEPYMMNNPIKCLVELQSLEFAETQLPEAGKRIEALRAKVPKPILDHYDRLCDCGKKGVAILRHQVCTGCHMRVPLATLLDLMAGSRIQLCNNCGRYLYLEAEPHEEAAPAPALTPAPVKKVRAKSTRKQLAHAL